jgi:hypothetical protein
MARVKDGLDAHAAGPGLAYVFSHRDELQVDGGYGQVGCLLALVSTAVGLVIGLAIAWLVTGGVSGGSALVGSVVGFMVAMFTADTVGTLLTSVPALRDRVVTLVYLYTSIVPGLITFLIIAVGSAQSR